MEQKNFRYSMKNIPIPSEKDYLKCLVEKIENFIRRIRWKAYFFEKAHSDNEDTGANYGFKSTKVPPQNQSLNAFENDLYAMVRSIEFKSSVNNAFQSQLKKIYERRLINLKICWCLRTKLETSTV